MEVEEEKQIPQQEHLLSEEIKYAMVVYSKDGLSNTQIAKKIKEVYNRQTHPTSVKRILERYEQLGNVENQWNMAGRPKLLSEQDKDQIIELVEENRNISANEIKNKLDTSVSRATVNKTLLEMGYHAYKSPQKLLLSESNKQQRLNFAQIHSSWSVADWEGIVFTDEVKFQIQNPDGRVFIRRKSDEQSTDFYQPSNSICKSIFLWGAISSRGPGPLVKIDGTLNADSYIKLFCHRLRRIYPELYEQKFFFKMIMPHLIVHKKFKIGLNNIKQLG